MHFLYLAIVVLITSMSAGVLAPAVDAKNLVRDADPADLFVETRGGQFVIGDKPYYFIGSNFWYGLNLGSSGPGGDRQRLLRELDRLQAMGATNLRVMAASEGPDTAPFRMQPALQPSPGQFDPEVFQGLDFLLAAMRQRGLRAVLCLGNFWQWSGGFAQYVAWAEGSAIPYPDQAGWQAFQDYAARFYVNPQAQALYNQAVEKVVERVNTITGVSYKLDPTIMAWELANEPRGDDQADAYVKWVAATAALIKQHDPRHLVTTGSEGLTPFPASSQTRPEIVHALPHIDYLTFHVWVQNFGWYDPQNPASYNSAVSLALAYLEQHVAMATRLGKPGVFEEFGIARDGGDFSPQAATGIRDRYYKTMFEAAYADAAQGRPLAGVNFWAWAGEGRPVHPGGLWQIGNPFIGDPPHEPQGWYSVYDRDQSTIALIKDAANKMRALSFR